MKSNYSFLCAGFVLFCFSTSTLPAQSPAETPADAAAQSGGGGGTTSNFLSGTGLGKPAFDPSNEVVSWDGNSWNVTNDRLFQGQFAEYLNSPEEDSAGVADHEQTLAKIHDLLSAKQPAPAAIDEAFKLLSHAAGLPVDAKIADVLRGQILAAWSANNETNRLQMATNLLQSERSRLEWNIKMATDQNLGQSSTSNKISEATLEAKRTALDQSNIQPLAKRLAEVETLLQKKDLDREYNTSQARTDFQTIIVTLFLQRRFLHVPVAIDFYRVIFNEDTQQIKLGDDAMSLFSKTTGGTPTLSTMDSASREMIQQVRQKSNAVNVMLGTKQLQAASQKLSEAFAVGQNLPFLELQPLDSKQAILAFTQKTNRLLAALDVKDYAQAEKLLDDLQTSAADFDPTKPNAAVQIAKRAAAMHLAKAQNAAVSGDKDTLEKELQAAAEIWPTNPQLTEMTAKIYEQADVGTQAIADFDHLLSQKNYRQIYDDKMRFIAATAMNPEKQQQLKKVLDDMTVIEMAMQRATEVDKRGDSAGAWESIVAVASTYPDDTKLNQYLANLTIKAATFVNALKSAEEYEKNGQYACAMTGFLAAQQIYPASDFAKDGILRVTKVLMPDAM